jgi:hypothetical protein
MPGKERQFLQSIAIATVGAFARLQLPYRHRADWILFANISTNVMRSEKK